MFRPQHAEGRRARPRVVLVKPHIDSDIKVPPIGLAYLAAMVRPYDPVVWDCNLPGQSREVLAQRIAQWKPLVVGVQAFATDVPEVRRVLEAVKQASPDTVTVVGGPHVTSAPGESLTHFGVAIDYALAGEAENALPRFIAAVAEGRNPVEDDGIAGLVYRRDSEVIARSFEWIADLSVLPLPAWDLVRPERYPRAPQSAFYRRFPIAPVICSRGCPYDCSFCAAQTVSGRKMRYRPVEQVMAEIELLRRDHGIREVHLIDDNFTLNRRYVQRFCAALHAHGIDIAWTCPNGVRLDTLDEGLLRTMRDAGLYAVSVGIESGSQRILDRIEKSLSVELVRQKVPLIRAAGIRANGFFILGFPTETRQEMEESIQFAIDLGLDRASFFPLHPHPGTGINRYLIEHEGYAFPFDSDDLSFARPIYAPQGMSADELKQMQRRAMRKFYLRPRALWNLIRDIRSPQHALYIARRIVRWMVTRHAVRPAPSRHGIAAPAGATS